MPLKVEADIISHYGFAHPARVILGGSSRTGKTEFIRKTLKYKLFDFQFSNIYYFYPGISFGPPVQWENEIEAEFQYICGLPSEAFFRSVPENSLIIIDDQWSQLITSEEVKMLFKVYSGKRNLSVMVTTQNYFEGGNSSRTIRNNTTHFVLFQNIDVGINNRIVSQMGLKQAFKSATSYAFKRPYNPVIVNMKANLESDKVRVMTNIFRTPITFANN